jgi:hypothetical protein
MDRVRQAILDRLKKTVTVWLAVYPSILFGHLTCGRPHAGLATATPCFGCDIYHRADCHQYQRAGGPDGDGKNRKGNFAAANEDTAMISSPWTIDRKS